MDEDGKSRSLSGGRLTALVLLSLALLIYWATVLRVDLPETGAFNLGPSPDACEYFAAAVSLWQTGTYTIQVAGHAFPPRYPFGYSVAQYLAMKSGVKPIEAPFLVNRMAGFVLLLLVFWGLFFKRFYHAAGLAVLLLATLPAFILLCRSPMSEMTSLLVVFGGCLALALGYGRGLAWSLAGSVLLGASLCFRLSNLFFVGALAFAIWTRPEPAKRRKMVHLALAGCLFLAGAAPILLYNYLHFGNPLKTGYTLWLPGAAHLLHLFNLKYVTANLLILWRDAAQKEARFTTANIYGTGSYFGPAFAALSLIGFLTSWKDRFFRPFLIASVSLFAIMLLYFFGSVRLFFPSLVLVVPAAAFTWERTLRRSGGAMAPWKRLRLGLMAILILLSCLGIPGKNGKPELLGFLDMKRLEGRPIAYETVQKLNGCVRGSPYLVLTNLNPPYVYALTAGDRIVAPLTKYNGYNFNKKFFPYGETEIQREIQAALEQGREVYALIDRIKPDELSRQRPAPPGYSWKMACPGPSTAGIAKLIRRDP